MVKPAGLFLYPGTFAGAAPVTTFKIVTIGEDLTDGVVAGWWRTAGRDRRSYFMARGCVWVGDWELNGAKQHVPFPTPDGARQR